MMDMGFILFTVHPVKAYVGRRKVVKPANTGASSLIPPSGLEVLHDPSFERTETLEQRRGTGTPFVA
jgi:hypothetical protein